MIPAPKGIMTSTRSNQGPGRIPYGSGASETDPWDCEIPYTVAELKLCLCFSSARGIINT